MTQGYLRGGIPDLRNCNGLLLMTGMMLAVLAGSQLMVRRVSRLQVEFAADLPPPLPTHASADGAVGQNQEH